jgi:hypothetical protein
MFREVAISLIAIKIRSVLGKHGTLIKICFRENKLFEEIKWN